VTTSIALSLISHTNAGKTTLARTLLGRDVGEVRDAAHVTQEATPYPMIETAQGEALVLKKGVRPVINLTSIDEISGQMIPWCVIHRTRKPTCEPRLIWMINCSSPPGVWRSNSGFHWRV